MLKTIVPARLEFRDGVAFAPEYGDIYHSADGGEGQSRHVFLEGCGLPRAWAARETFVVLETGFGTGLNFLTTWAAWRDDPARPSRLHYLSVEKHPFTAHDLARLHAQWPALAPYSAELVARWPMPVPGFHRIAFDEGRVQLTLLFGDAADCLPQVEARVDAFYLDGFAPARNAGMWQPAVFDAIARLAQPESRVATYTVESGVRAELARVGFDCEKRPGFGRKRHCLAARFASGKLAPPPPRPRRITVIGAGVAGAAVAHALATRGVAVTVLERAAAPATGASGNPVAVFRPLVSRDDNLTSRLTRAAFLHDLRTWPALGERLEWARCGVAHVARDDDMARKLQRALAELSPPEAFAAWLEPGALRKRAGWPVAAAGAWYAGAGWIDPASLCAAWLDTAGIEFRSACAVERVEHTATGWRCVGADSEVLAESDAVVLANAWEASRLASEQGWPLHAVRGQVTALPAGSLPELACVVAREGYVAPGSGRPVVGATYEHDDLDLAARAESDRFNLARLETLLPGASARIAPDAVRGRAALRATLPDRFPLLGAVTGPAGRYVAAGYGSRGVVWAGLFGEALADLMTGQPLPLERDLMRAMSPARFSLAGETAPEARQAEG